MIGSFAMVSRNKTLTFSRKVSRQYGCCCLKYILMLYLQIVQARVYAQGE